MHFNFGSPGDGSPGDRIACKPKIVLLLQGGPGVKPSVGNRSAGVRRWGRFSASTRSGQCGRIPGTLSRIRHKVLEVTTYSVLLSESPNVRVENRSPSGAGTCPRRLPSGDMIHTPPAPVE